MSYYVPSQVYVILLSTVLFSLLHIQHLFMNIHDGEQGYKVFYTLTPDLPISLWTVHPVDNSQLTTITNLLTNRTYTMSVLAYTGLGDGPLSDAIAVRTNQGGEVSSQFFGGQYDSAGTLCYVRLLRL